MYTYEGNDITDLLVEVSRIDDAKHRNEILVNRMAELGFTLDDKECSFLFGIVNGMNFEAHRQSLS